MNFNGNNLILHCDLNNFYASVECNLNPDLRNVPMAVCGDPSKRHGIILAKNEIAKKMGVKTAEPIWQAQSKAANLVLVPPNMDLYSRYSNLVFDIYTRFTPLVEPFGPDECWLDLTDCGNLLPYKGQDVYEYGRLVADKIRETVFAETALTVSVGVSFNKIYAKMGSDLKKPNATSVVSKANFKQVLYPLPAADLFMVGAKTAEKLRKLNIYTVGDIANADVKMLKTHFGINGESMYINARGENLESIREYVLKRDEKSVGHGITTSRDVTSYEDAECVIFMLSDKVAARLRKKNRCGCGVALDMRDFNLHHVSKQKKISPTCSATSIAKEACKLLRDNWDKSNALRTITVSVFDLSPAETGQLNMFDSLNNQKNENLEKTLDNIRSKYGSGSIRRGNVFGKDFIYDKDDDEDFLPFKR